MTEPMISPSGRRILICLSASLACAAALAQDDKDEAWQAGTEKKYTMKFELTAGTDYCQSKTSIEYEQRNNIAKVAGAVAIEGCDDATGEYTISIRTRDENGKIKNTNHAETWSRTGAAPVTFAKDYEIGENVDLVRVRARKTRCVCSNVESEVDNNPQN